MEDTVEGRYKLKIHFGKSVRVTCTATEGLVVLHLKGIQGPAQVIDAM